MFDEQDQGVVQIGWFNLTRTIDNTGWLSDEPDKEKGIEMKSKGTETGIVVMAGRADEKGKLPKNVSMENPAREVDVVSTTDTE